MTNDARPNLLYVMCDELRWCEMGTYGHPVVPTPHLDRLAAGGVRVEHAVSNAPVCMPARSVVLSGQHARTCTGNINNSTLMFRRQADGGGKGWLFDAYCPPEKCGFGTPTLAELLRDAGYHTRAVGKWHVDAWPHLLGFDHYLIPRSHHAHSAQPFTENGGPEHVPPGFSVDYEADRVCDFLRDSSTESGGKPWFLYYNISPPHMPLADMPETYLTMFTRDDVADQHVRGNVPAGFRPDDERIRAYLWDYRAYLNHLPHAVAVPDDFGLRDLIALYWGATVWVDDKVGQVLNALDEAGLADDTLVVFTSDHGDMLGSHGRMGKSTLHEESARVPFLTRGPGLPGGRVADDGVASLVDVAPTFLSAAGADVPDHLQGTNLLPALRGDTSLPPHAIIESTNDGTGVRTTTHSYGLPARGEVVDRTLGEAPHRFTDLRDDPLQLATADQPDLARQLDRLLRDWDAATPWHHGPTPKA